MGGSAEAASGAQLNAGRGATYGGPGVGCREFFESFQSGDNPQATALRVWLVLREPPLANEIFLDTDPDAGLRPGER